MTVARVLRGMRQGVEIASMPVMVGVVATQKEVDHSADPEDIQQSIYTQASLIIILAMALEASKCTLAYLEAIVEDKMSLGRLMTMFGMAGLGCSLLNVSLQNIGVKEAAGFSAITGVAGIGLLSLANQIAQTGSIEEATENQERREDIETAYQTPGLR